MSSPPRLPSYRTCPLSTLSAHTVLQLGRLMRSLGGRGEPGGALIPFKAAAAALFQRTAELPLECPETVPTDTLSSARQNLQQILGEPQLLNATGEHIPTALLRLEALRCALRPLTEVLDIAERRGRGERVVLPNVLHAS